VYKAQKRAESCFEVTVPQSQNKKKDSGQIVPSVRKVWLEGWLCTEDEVPL